MILLNDTTLYSDEVRCKVEWNGHRDTRGTPCHGSKVEYRKRERLKITGAKQCKYSWRLKTNTMIHDHYRSSSRIGL
jgi:hypothetical protein